MRFTPSGSKLEPLLPPDETFSPAFENYIMGTLIILA